MAETTSGTDPQMLSGIDRGLARAAGDRELLRAQLEQAQRLEGLAGDQGMAVSQDVSQIRRAAERAAGLTRRGHSLNTDSQIERSASTN